MRTFATLVLFGGCVALVACGKGSDSPTTESARVGPAAGVTAPAATPAAPVGEPFVGTGVVVVQGVSIEMQGTHKLVEGGKTVCLLESRKVDLRAHEGRRVRLSGAARPTVEGGKTIVDVQTIDDLP